MSSRRLAMIAAAALAVFAIGGLLQVRVDTTMRSFLPSGDPTFKALEERSRSFGDDPIVVLVESKGAQELLRQEASLLGLLHLEGALAGVPDVASVYGPATVLNQVAKSAQNILAEIMGRRDALQQVARVKAEHRGAEADAIEDAGRAAVRSFDRRYGALLVSGLPAGLPTLKNSAFVAKVLYDEDQSVRPQWRFVVPDDHSVALLVRPREGLDQEANSRLVASVKATVADADLDVERITISGVPAVAAGLSDRAQKELPVLGAIALCAVGLVFLFAPWSQRRRYRIAPLACALSGSALTVAGFGWLDRPLSLGVVAFLPILMGIGSDFPYYLLTHSRRRRVVVAASAAAAGFAALVFSPLPFVRELGIALCVGVLATVGVALLVRVAIPAVAPPRRPVAPPRPSAGRAAPSESWSTGQWMTLMALAVVVAGLGWLALPQLDIEGRPERLASGLSELDDAQHVEEVLGSSGEVGVMLSGKDAFSPAALSWAKRVEETIVRRHGDEVRPVVTPSILFRFLGDRPTASQVDAGLSLMPSYLASAVVRSDRSASLMTFGVDFDDLDRQRELIEEIVDDLPAPPEGLQAQVVGIPVVVAHGIELASAGRGWLNLVGALAACIVIAVGLGRAEALRVAATILISTGWVLGLAWLFLGSLNPLTVAIGSLTTATACEFAVMLSGRSQGRGRGWLVVGTAALAGIAGYSALAFSHLAFLREFGLLLASSVALSYVAALIVTSRPATGAKAVPVDVEQRVSERKGLLV